MSQAEALQKAREMKARALDTAKSALCHKVQGDRTA